jgi:fructose-1,6-bisphosphatase/inositol monophosphatase family enzyme
MPQHVRAYIYRALVVVGALLVFYGVIGEDELNAWLMAAGTLLVLESGLASANTTTKRN